MKHSRFFSIPFRGLPLLAAWFLLIALSACRHTTPTEPSPTPNTDSCCNGMITLHAQDSAGHAISGATVALAGPNAVTRNETTNGDGNSTIVHLCPGRYVIHTTYANVVRESVFELTCNDTTHGTVIFPVAPNATDCCHGRITLMVRDSATNAVLDGGSATLYYNGQALSTKPMSANGTVWDGLCPGQYAFNITKDGYHSTEFHIDSMGCNATRTVNRTMSSVHGDCCGGVFELAVKDSMTGHGIAGATVALTGNGMSWTMTTGNDGGVRFANLCQGGYHATISKDGYPQTVLEFKLGCNQGLGITKSLLAYHNAVCDTASLGITVRDSVHQDTPVAGATVTVYLGNVVVAHGTTDDHGYFQTPSTLNGSSTYTVHFTKDGYHEKSFTWQIGECYTHTETFYLSHQ